MRHWPDKDEALLNEFLDQIGYARKNTGAYRFILRHFQRFAGERKRPLDERTLRSWLKSCAAESKSLWLRYVVDRARFVKRFLDWLVEREIVKSNPITALQERYECQLTARRSSGLSSIHNPSKRSRPFSQHPSMPVTSGRSFAATWSECGRWAIAIVMPTGSSASIDFWSNGLARRMNL